MVKGFIFFRDGKMPFVIENYRMELFTDDSLLDDFCKEYNFKENYILHGQCFDIGIRGRKATFLVENSMGSTCYLHCYTINMFDKDEDYDSIVGGHGGFFHEFDVMKYIPKILNNIALDYGNKITQSIPLGHLGDFNSMYTPQRFVEQVMAFEYLFDKLDHKNAQNPKFPLKKELECMFNEFPQLLSLTKIPAEMISDQIKEIRRTIAHGYAYYYDFKNDSNTKCLMILLDKLIKCMSLKWIGFSNNDISNYILF